MNQPTAQDTERMDEAIQEITKLQGEIQVRARRIHELATTLYRRVRRAPADDSTHIYMTYANAVTRFAGTIDQVSARTERTTRVLGRLPGKIQAQDPKKDEPKPKVTQVEDISSPMESLISLYVSEPEAASPKSES